MARQHQRVLASTAVLASPEAALPSPTRGTVRRSLGIAPHSAAYKWWVAATVMLSAFLVVASGATVNVALPSMMTAFGLNLDQVQWVMTAYMIAGAVLIPTI